MSIFKHHDKKESDTSEATESPRSSDDDASAEESFEGTENPIELEHDRALARQIRSTTPIRPPGI
ncbi:hypothetical protein [Demequina aurantiaca]|uniref:hypothetical protein n=1 Tax=Demequina aurantiaca TaxID=676200 RepID=UPI003D32B8C5